MSLLATLGAATLSVPVAADPANPILAPVVEAPWAKVLCIFAAYAFTLLTSGKVVQWIAGNPHAPASEEAPSEEERGRRRRLGRIIGKCENIIAVTLILAGQETGLALIFAAKSIVRRDDIKADPDYYLGGTLVNLVWSLLVAFLVRTLIGGL